MNSIINLIFSDIPKSFVEVKKDGATFDVPLPSILGESFFSVRLVSGATEENPYILDFSTVNTQIFNLNLNTSAANYILLTNPIVGKIYTIFTVHGGLTETSYPIFTSDAFINLNLNTGFPTTTGNFCYTAIYDGNSWYLNCVEYFPI
jgi:hypothetical protein